MELSFRGRIELSKEMKRRPIIERNVDVLDKSVIGPSLSPLTLTLTLTLHDWHFFLTLFLSFCFNLSFYLSVHYYYSSFIDFNIIISSFLLWQPTGDILLDEALKLIQTDKQTVSSWIDLLSGEAFGHWQFLKIFIKKKKKKKERKKNVRIILFLKKMQERPGTSWRWDTSWSKWEKGFRRDWWTRWAFPSLPVLLAKGWPEEISPFSFTGDPAHRKAELPAIRHGHPPHYQHDCKGGVDQEDCGYSAQVWVN